MSKNHNKGNKIILVFLVALLIAIMASPSTAYDSAMRGLSLWWEIVVPALLPFFMISELLLELNITRYLEKATSPLMRPLFALPGAASLAVALGFCSGFPSGAAITAALRRKKQISREEGERLICFTNNSGPLYISVAVAGGLLHCPQAAVILALSHYGGNLLIGIGLGLIARLRRVVTPKETAAQFDDKADIALKDFGGILKAAVKHSAANITTIGCLMTFFAVTTGAIMSFDLPGDSIVQAFYQGFWEMSLGVNALADSGLALCTSIPATAAVLGFGGLSVQMQVLAMIGGTDIRIFPYLASRIIHALLSFGIAALLCTVITLPASGVAYFAPEINILRFAIKTLAIALGSLLTISLLNLWLHPLFQRLHKS